MDAHGQCYWCRGGEGRGGTGLNWWRAKIHVPCGVLTSGCFDINHLGCWEAANAPGRDEVGNSSVGLFASVAIVDSEDLGMLDAG